MRWPVELRSDVVDDWTWIDGEVGYISAEAIYNENRGGKNFTLHLAFIDAWKYSSIINPASILLRCRFIINLLAADTIVLFCHYLIMEYIFIKWFSN